MISGQDVTGQGPVLGNPVGVTVESFYETSPQNTTAEDLAPHDSPSRGAGQTIGEGPPRIDRDVVGLLIHRGDTLPEETKGENSVQRSPAPQAGRRDPTPGVVPCKWRADEH